MPAAVEEARRQVVAGALAATISTVACHPIDVIRTELQVHSHMASASLCFRQIVTAQGVMGLYKGLSAPLAAQAAYKAIIFGVNSVSQSWLLSRKRLRGEPAKINYAEMFWCGTLAGSVNSLLVAPVELIRNRLVALRGRYSGPVDCMREILARNGPRGLWKGLVPTVLRDGPGVGVWILGFEASKEMIRSQRGPLHRDAPLSFPELLLAGMVAGISFWTVALPLDTIKSVVQVQDHGRGQHGGMVDTTLRLVRHEGGVRRLFRGWQGAFGRALPGSATTLAVYDLVKDKM